MGRPCSICSNSENYRRASAMIAAGATDQAIASRIGGLNRMSVARHRHNHVIAPARAVVHMAEKGAAAAAQRAQVASAVEAGDPMAFVGLAAIVSDLRRVHDRLERQADLADQGRQATAVAALSAQQLRAAEVRAKIGGVGGFALGRAGEGAAGTFSVTINLGGDQDPIRITTLPVIERGAVEALVDD